MYLFKLYFTLTLLFQLYENKSYSGRKLVYIALSKKLDPDIASILGEELDRLITITGSEFPSKQIAAEELINTNLTRALKLKKKLQKQKIYGKSGVYISQDAFLCDRRFCNKLGNGRHAIGVCSPYYCLCKKNDPHPVKCGAKRTFDPIESECVKFSIICGG